MNCDPESLNGYLRHIEQAEASDKVLIAVSKEGDGYILAGAHGGDAWCWCQPVVIEIPCHGGMTSGDHMGHSQVNHRRTMDGMVLDDDRPAGFAVTSEGHTYPRGQVCVGPGDKPSKS